MGKKITLYNRLATETGEMLGILNNSNNNSIVCVLMSYFTKMCALFHLIATELSRIVCVKEMIGYLIIIIMCIWCINIIDKKNMFLIRRHLTVQILYLE